MILSIIFLPQTLWAEESFFLYPSSPEMNQIVESVIQEGWPSPSDPKLDEIIHENQKFYFSFHEKIKEKKPLDIPANRRMVSLIQMTDLFLLKSRYEQFHKNSIGVLEMLVDGLELARYLSGQKGIENKLASLSVRDKVYAVIPALLETKALGFTERKKLAAYLEDYRSQHFPFAAMIEDEKSFYLETLKKLTRGEITTDALGVPFRWRQAEYDEEFLAAIREEGYKLSAEYFDSLKEIAKNPGSDVWTKGHQAIRQSLMRASLFSESKVSEELNQRLERLAKRKNPEDTQIASREIALLLLKLSLPDFEPANRVYHKSLSQLEERIQACQNSLI